MLSRSSECLKIAEKNWSRLAFDDDGQLIFRDEFLLGFNILMLAVFRGNSFVPIPREGDHTAEKASSFSYDMAVDEVARVRNAL